MKVENRVKKYSEFQLVINDGELLRSNTLSLYFLKNNLDRARVGISVPKKAGHAVLRNKIKRQIRAILAKELDFKKSIDYVFIPKKAYSVENFEQTVADIRELIKKVG